MENLYQKYAIPRRASRHRIRRQLEKLIRRQIDAKQKPKHSIAALCLLTSEYPKKIYDRQLKGYRVGARAMRTMENYYQRNLVDYPNFYLKSVFKEASFWYEKTEILLMQTTGLDFLFHFGDEQGRSGYGFLLAKFYKAVNYGIPLFLGFYLNHYFLLGIPLLMLWHLRKHYRQAKIDWYQQNLVNGKQYLLSFTSDREAKPAE